MRTLGILIFLVLYGGTVLGQSVRLSGVVTDSLQQPLAYANVVAKPFDTSKSMVFVITDDTGSYAISLKKNERYAIRVTYMGFKPSSFSYTPLENSVKNIVLEEASNDLKEVVIELPVSVRGDTITYHTDKFTNGKERKLKNILKKLPGVEVDKQGNVKVQGKKVTKMLVDGKPFFGGNSKLAIENIPADAVANVQAIRNYNEVAFLKNLSDADKLAMNIALKENKKRFVFGDAELGKGNDEFYKAASNLFYYAPKTNINFIGSSANTGTKTFTFQDYLSFQGGVNAVFSENFDWKGGDFATFLEPSDQLRNREHFGAINLNTSLNSKLSLAGYAIFSDTAIESLESNINTYANFVEQQRTAINTDNTLGISKISLDYAPNADVQWYFRTQVKRIRGTKNNAITSAIKGVENRITTGDRSSLGVVNTSAEWHKKGRGRHTYSAIAKYVYDTNSIGTDWLSTGTLLNGITPIDPNQQVVRVQQQRTTQKHEFSTVFKNYWVLHRNHHLYTTLGTQLNRQKFLTSSLQLLDSGETNNFQSSGFGNNFMLDFSDVYMGMHYKLRSGKFTFKQGAYLHRYAWNTTQNEPSERSNWLLLPDFLMKVAFTKTRSLNVKYQLKSNLPEIAKMAGNYYLQTYNAVFRGNTVLENELYHDLSVNYSQFSLYRGVLLAMNASYLNKLRGFTNTVAFNSVNRFTTVELLSDVSEHWSMGANLEKTIGKLKYKVSADYFGTEFVQKIDQSLVKNKSHNYSYELGIETLFEKFPSIEFGYRGVHGNYLSSNQVNSFSSYEPFIEVTYDFLKSFQWNFDYTYHQYRNVALGVRNTYQLANTGLLYQQEDSPWTFKISAKNLWNAAFKRSNSFSDYLVVDTKTFVMPRVVLLSVNYRL